MAIHIVKEAGYHAHSSTKARSVDRAFGESSMDLRSVIFTAALHALERAAVDILNRETFAANFTKRSHYGASEGTPRKYGF